MRRFWTLLILAVVLIVVSLATACKKENPGPTPEPTPVATEVPPDPNVATCYTPAQGAPGGGVCQNAQGEQVTCPDDATTAKLPACP